MSSKWLSVNEQRAWRNFITTVPALTAAFEVDLSKHGVTMGDYDLVSSLSGMLTTYDAKTGAILFSERLGSQVSAMPVTAGGLVYFQMENGEVIVVKPGKTLEIVSRNKLDSANDEIFRAGLSPIQGQWFARSQGTVYCIGAKAK